MRMRMYCLWTIVLFSATCLQCSGQCTKTIVTFNTALTPKVEHYEERRQALPLALRDLDADVVCLQEVWFSDDVEAIVETVQSVFPFSYSLLHDDRGILQNNIIGTPPCAVLRTVWFLPCMLACRDTETTREYLECAIHTCGLMDLPQECITCLSMTISIKSVVGRCIATFTEGSNEPGLLLLSRTPLRRAKVTRFIPGVQQVLPRSYIEAEVDRLGHVMCGHLTPNLGSVYFEPLLKDKYSTWDSQNLDDVHKLLNVVKFSEKALIMADLNAGPRLAEKGLQGDFEDSYQAMVGAGLVCPYITGSGQCTFCSSNPLVTDSSSYILDHIMVRGYTWTGSRRIFDGNMSGHGFPLSDHYAVEVTLFAD